MSHEPDDELDASLKRALHREPGEAYFESFATRVTERIAAEAKADAVREAERSAPWWRGLFASPRALAAMGSVAVLVLAVGVTVVMMRNPGGGPASVVASGDAKRSSAPAAESAPSGATAFDSQAPAETRQSAESDAPASSSRALATPASPLPASSSLEPPTTDAAKNAAGGAAVAPQRMQELRTTESGEQVPVQNAWRSRMAEREAASSAPRTPAELKRESVSPLAQQAPPPAAKSAPAPPAPTAAAEDRAASAKSVGETPAQPAPVIEETVRKERAVADERGGARRSSNIGEAEVPSLVGATTGTADPSALAPAPTSGITGDLRAFTRRDAAKQATPFGSEAPALLARIEDAEAKSAAARRARTGAAWDVAALAWQSLATSLATPGAQIEARWRAADARLRAWRAEPSPAREAAAAEAARGFEAAAPRDPRVRTLMSPSLPWGAKAR